MDVDCGVKILTVSLLLCVACSAAVQFSGTSCDVQVKCEGADDSMMMGRPGKRGPKGDKGESCYCDETYNCPQTKFLFPRHGQVTDYIRYKPAVPELKEVSTCMWITPQPSNHLTMLSYATKSSDNMFIIMFMDKMLRVYKRTEGLFNIKVEKKTHLCVVVSSASKSVAVYIDGVRKASSTFQDSLPIEGGGSLIFGQEQDKVAGGFDADQSYGGEIENFMMWYRILSETEIVMMYKNRCACAPGYSVALVPELIQLAGAVTALPTGSC